MAAFLRVLPTRWRRGRFAYKMAAMQNKQNENKNNVEYVLRLQCRIYLLNVTRPSDSSMSDVRHWTVWRSTVTRWTFENAQRHVTAIRPISEAARSWSCDETTMTNSWLHADNKVLCSLCYAAGYLARSSRRCACAGAARTTAGCETSSRRQRRTVPSAQRPHTEARRTAAVLDKLASIKDRRQTDRVAILANPTPYPGLRPWPIHKVTVT